MCVYPVHVGGRRPASPVLQLRACRGQPSKGALSRGQRSQGVPGFRDADTFDHLPDRLDHKLRLILVDIVTTLGCNEKARIWNEGGEFHVEVLQLSEMRGPAAVAQTLYRETEASKELRLKEAAERKAMQEFAPLPEHRPSKRDRRRIIQFRGRG